MIRSISWRRYLRMATPRATGRPARPTMVATKPTSQRSHHTPTASETTQETKAPKASTAAAQANHLICWRSTPLDLRSRHIREPADTSVRAKTTASTALDRLGTPSMPAGLRMGASVSIVPGEYAVATLPATTAAATSQAKGRQRDEGSLPSGNSSPRNANRPECTTHNQETIQADALAAGDDPA